MDDILHRIHETFDVAFEDIRKQGTTLHPYKERFDLYVALCTDYFYYQHMTDKQTYAMKIHEHLRQFEEIEKKSLYHEVSSSLSGKPHGGHSASSHPL